LSIEQLSMELTLLKSKIHRATVTGANVDYEGSLTISSDLAELAGLLEYEKILVGNLNNGERFETYAIYGQRQRGIIELNGATAHLGKIGDRLTIMSFARLAPDKAAINRPRILVLDGKNKIVRYEEGASTPTNSSGVLSPVAGVEALAAASACSVDSAVDATAATTSGGFAFPRGKSSEPSLNSIT
jgi:aspartate 1-decarboxylase